MNNLDFYLFDVGHGQCAAARLPNGRWCVFDLGASAEFSPVRWISSRLGGQMILKTTVSHLHGDHLADLPALARVGTEYIRVPIYDRAYLADARATASGRAAGVSGAFADWHRAGFGPAVFPPDYGGVRISEISLSAADARVIGGETNTAVNNASVVSRIDYGGRSILICGDMEAAAWEAMLNGPNISDEWFKHVLGVDVLVAPHHGHKSGYSYALMLPTNPKLVLTSVSSKDPSVDSRYSSDEITGVQINGQVRRQLTTRTDGHIRVSIPQTSTGGIEPMEIATSKVAPPPPCTERLGFLLSLLGSSLSSGVGK